MNKHSILSLSFTLLLCFACKETPFDLESALRFAGDNRPELEKVLQHYKENSADSLKYRAAVFLITNMRYYCSYKDEKLALYHGELRKTAISNKCSGSEAVQILERRYGPLDPSGYEIVYDSRAITADYLIRNIEQAFKVWHEQAWGKRITFDDFCEQILPYRIKDEALDDWREVYYNRFQPVLDSLLTNRGDPVEAIQVLWDSLNSPECIHLENKPAGYTYPSALSLLDHRIGDCYESAGVAVYVMRALGIPGGLESYLQHPSGRGHHLWNFVTDTLGNNWEFSMYARRPRLPQQQKKPIVGRVYQKCFAVQKESLPVITRGKKDLPRFLNNAFIRDISDTYFPASSSIEVKASRMTRKDKILYLCTFGYEKWEPIAWAEWKDGSFTFKHAERSMIYLPAYYKDGKIIPASAPCFVNRYGIANFFEIDKTGKQKLALTRKFPARDSWQTYNFRLIGGQFQASNDSAFTHVDTLYTFTRESEMQWATIRLPGNTRYRYIRYFSSDNGFCNMAEVQIISSGGKMLKGKIIGTEGSYHNGRNNRKEALFDNDPLTFYDAVESSGAWAGLDLGSPQTIEKINYIFRNDDNNIRIGDDYELFYWDNQWRSLGRQVADQGILEFEDAPVGALLWLHDYTRGKEEVPFVYVNGVQMFIDE